MIAINQVRKDTQHCHDKVFFNSAGSSLMPHVVVEKINTYLKQEERLGGYKVTELQQEQIEGFYQEVARLLHCQSRNIAFAGNASIAFANVLSAIPFRQGDVIITTDDDYSSNYINFISLQKRFGVKLVRMQNLENGDLDVANFKELMEKYQPKLVSVSHIPTSSGLIQDVEAIGNVCANYETIYLVDACQSVGQLTIDVNQIKCDFLSATGRKFMRGPRGTGFLYVSDKMLNKGYTPLFMDLRGADWTAPNQYKMIDTAKRFEVWELPYAFVVGLKEAVKYANNIGMEAIWEYNQQLMATFRKGMADLSKIRVLDKGSRKSNILTFATDAMPKNQLIKLLDSHSIYYSITHKSSAVIDFEKKNIDWAMRLSPHYFNTMDEVTKVIEVLKKV